MTDRRFGINETTTRTDAHESDLARRAREITARSQGAPGVPSGEALDAITRAHQRRISAGEFSKSSHSHLPTVSGSRGDESTFDSAQTALEAAIEENQSRLRKTLKAAGYSDSEIATALIALTPKRTDETRADDGEYIVDRLRREANENARTAWQK